jgi:hypothetical protein
MCRLSKFLEPQPPGAEGPVQASNEIILIDYWMVIKNLPVKAQISEEQHKIEM